MTGKSAMELNRVLGSSDFPYNQFATLQDLLDYLGIADAGNYMFIGRRFEGDSQGIPLLPGSSLRGLHKVAVVSYHIGGA
jgi:hypothetical protein